MVERPLCACIIVGIVASEDLHRTTAAAAMVGAILLVFVCELCF